MFVLTLASKGSTEHCVAHVECVANAQGVANVGGVTTGGDVANIASIDTVGSLANGACTTANTSHNECRLAIQILPRVIRHPKCFTAPCRTNLETVIGPLMLS